MKAITLYQPWATLVAVGAKKIETRSWGTSYRGRLAIHAGKNVKHVNPKYEDYICDQDPFYTVLKDAGYVWPSSPVPLGCVVATCNLVHVFEMSILQTFPACKAVGYKGHQWKMDQQERSFGLYEPGRFMWLLDDIQMLPEPIPAKGSMGFWEWEGGK